MKKGRGVWIYRCFCFAVRCLPSPVSRLPIVFFLILYGCGGISKSGNDYYTGFARLKADLVYAKDYSTHVLDRKSEVTVLAIHGGGIEPVTSEIARALAGGKWNLYVFEALCSAGCPKLHLSSQKFDDPEAVRLIEPAFAGVSIHGMAGGGEMVCIGGSNAGLRSEVSKSLSSAGFKTQEPCVKFPGIDAGNIVNRAQKGGVQLEISMDLRRKLEADSALTADFCSAVRSAVYSWMKNGDGRRQAEKN